MLCNSVYNSVYNSNFLTFNSRREFTDDIGKAVIEGMMTVIPDEWKADAFAPSLSFNGPAVFHRPGLVYAVDMVVAVPNRK